jgi:hypothetical protein
LNSAASELESVFKAIGECRDFAALMNLLEPTLENVWGIGELTTHGQWPFSGSVYKSFLRVPQQSIDNTSIDVFEWPEY